MLKLYGGAFSRAAIVKWYLEELAVPYEFVLLDMKAGQHLQPEFLAINPMGKVPAIVDGDFKLWESGAILLYLHEKYDTVPSELEKRAEIIQWILFINATLPAGIFDAVQREKEMPRLLLPIDRILSHQSFMLGEKFGVVDVAVGSTLAFIPIMLKLDLSEYPGITAYLKRLAERPAFQKTMRS